MKKLTLTLLFSVFLPLAVTAKTVSTIWDGTTNTTWYTNNKYAIEYTITTAEQLAGLAQLVNGGNTMSGKIIKLGADIMLNDTANWQNWETTPPRNTWTAIGTYYNEDSDNKLFSGTFDGNGHVVSGVYINNTKDFQGLFSYIEDEIIKNVGVVAFYIKGGEFVGGLAGYNYEGTVGNSYSTGTVSGTEAVGGLVGTNYYGTIINSYSTGTVSGGSCVGGLVGNNWDGTIINSYSTGKVNGTEYVGGLVGLSNYDTVINSYYDKETCGQSDTRNGEARTTEEMQSKEFTAFLNVGAGVLSMNAWVYAGGQYPKLSNTVAGAINKIASYFASGTGTEANPYIIKTKEHLEYFSLFVNLGNNFSGKYFKLGNHIALNDTTRWQNWATTPPKYSWIAIGTHDNYNGHPFSGIFNGNGYVISGVYINTYRSYQGLFGYVSGGAIKNVGVVASYIKGGNYVGGLVGYNSDAIISNSYSTGAVSGGDVVGCLVADNNRGTVINSYYDKETCEQSDTGKGLGKTTAEMKKQSTFVGWDFKNIWGISKDIKNGYPYLRENI